MTLALAASIISVQPPLDWAWCLSIKNEPIQNKRRKWQGIMGVVVLLNNHQCGSNSIKAWEAGMRFIAGNVSDKVSKQLNMI